MTFLYGDIGKSIIEKQVYDRYLNNRVELMAKD